MGLVGQGTSCDHTYPHKSLALLHIGPPVNLGVCTPAGIHISEGGSVCGGHSNTTYRELWR